MPSKLFVFLEKYCIVNQIKVHDIFFHQTVYLPFYFVFKPQNLRLDWVFFSVGNTVWKNLANTFLRVQKEYNMSLAQYITAYKCFPV